MYKVVAEPVEIGGYRKIKVTILDGERTVDTDLVNPLNAAQRRRASERLAKLSGDRELTADHIEQKIIESLDKLRDQQAKEQALPKGAGIPLGEVRVVRPELLVTPQVTGLSIPEPISRDGTLSYRWRLYLAWQDGRREARDLTERIDLCRQLEQGDAQAVQASSPKAADCLWVFPQPAEPKEPRDSDWSTLSRQSWLAGEASPDPLRLFTQLCDALDHLLDMPGCAEGNGATPGAEANGPLPIQVPVYSADGTISGTRTAPWSTVVVSLWTMLSYCYPAWDAVPYLYIGGPSGSGKTRLFEIIQRTCFRAFSSSNTSAPALFRTLHDRGGVLLLDEAERLQEGAPEVGELRSILLAGYKRGGRATRLESAGDGFVMQEFHVYGPKAIACINGLTGPLSTRCIPIQMFRAVPDSPKPRRRVDADPQRWSSLRDQLHRLALGQLGSCASILADQEDVCPFGGRHHELWQPLLSLAELVDSDGKLELAKRLTQHAGALIRANQEQHVPEADLLILRTLTKYVLRGTHPTCKQILAGAEQEDKDEVRSYTARRVSEVLSRYRITTIKSNGSRIFRDVTLAQLQKIERAYGVDLGTTEEQQTNWRRY